MSDDLTKWPRLLVTGTPVTPEQADDILIRTANLYLLDGNDKAWTLTVYRAFGLMPGPYGNATMETIHAVSEELAVLPLSLLYTSRVASSWIGGPHGWCDWDGRVGTANYSLGKYPDRAIVTAEWQMIAAAFPYLDLTAQLVGDEGEGRLLGQWRVAGGHAAEETVGPLITELVELTEDDVLSHVLLPGGERGVCEARLRAAVERVRAACAARR